MADESDEEESWHSFFKNNRSVPLHKTRQEKEDIESIPYRLKIKSVEGIPIPSTVRHDSVEFQVRVTLYDAANKKFFGSTWLGAYLPCKKIDENKGKIFCNEAVYFHSPLSDVTCIGAVELIALDESTRTTFSCGWGILRIFDSTISMKDSSTTNDIAINRLTFLSGTVQALFYMNEPLEEFPGLLAIPGCQLVYQLSRHSSLGNALHLFPENVLIGGDDIVPGIREGPPDANGVIDILHKPRLEKTIAFFVDKLYVGLHPSVEDFEKQLTDDLNSDRMLKRNVQEGCPSVKIVERKLQVQLQPQKVGVHNGWTFVSKPHSMVLDPEYTGQVTIGNRPNSMSSLKGNITRLILRSRLNLSDLVADKLFVIVFQLIYVMSEEFAKPVLVDNTVDVKKKRTSWRNNASLPSGSLVRSKTFNVCVRQGIWEPFKDGNPEETNVTLVLQGGHHYHPGNVFTWFGPQRKETFKDTVRFRFTAKKKTEQKRVNSRASSRRHSTRESMGTAESNSVFGGQSSPGVPYKDTESPHEETISFQSDFPPYRPPSQIPTQTPISQDILVDTRVSGISEHHSPLIRPPLASGAAFTLSRAGHGRLTSAQFQKILDRHGNPPINIDPSVVRQYDLKYEQTDIRHCNEIIIQFFALSACFHHTVFFTYQFYRLPEVKTERLALIDVENQAKNQSFLPCLLQKFDSDGTIDKNPGLQFKYFFDPCDMLPGEMYQLWNYLKNHRLYIDVWNGESLLLIGSTSLDLKHLLRQGQEAVQAMHELDILSTDYCEHLPATGEATRNVGLRSAGSAMKFQDKLYLRIANIGHPSENKSEKPCIVPRKQRYVVKADINEGQYAFPTRSKAKLMKECDRELARVLLSRDANKKGTSDGRPIKESDAVRQRKLERMQAIRKTQKGLPFTTTHLIKEEKVQRARDLKTVQMYRQKWKKEGIMELLSRNITTTHTIYPSFGQAVFFEFVLKNPYASESTVIVQCDDNELMVVSNTQEWKEYKKLTQTSTNIEEDMFNLATESGYPEIFMRSQETVNIPFKYQSFKSTSEQASSILHAKDENGRVVKKKELSYNIKVVFETPQQQRLAILSLKVELQPLAVDQTFRFNSPEQTYFKKTIRLPHWHALADEPLRDGEVPREMHVRCSDINVICNTTSNDQPQDIFLKVPCGASPSVRRFFLFVYTDRFHIKPKQTWQLYVHSLQRLDISSTQGQSSRLSCVLRGTHSSRLVQCFSSLPAELQVEPSDPFMLMANGVQEVSLNFTPCTPGLKQIIVNVVDTEFSQLLRSWLVCATSRPPVISKTFDINVELGGGKGSRKRIQFINPYQVGKTFYLKCNLDNVLHLENTTLNLGPGEAQSISLRFQPRQSAAQLKILVFVYDGDGKNEETFLLNVIYR
ncbi:nephrocystin-4-like isoform X2 [Xenia sp. Carnegie-2017]|uniref:nephrocystin-4-like isoform X2 n=1 Tax=Xenia sp. Carnegie-2017 TaxID=2897299 RepID=UPI001F04283D|nr:nephrocystin-4-like isoform X2 [Xenia sp. Carnegie-2017]